MKTDRLISIIMVLLERRKITAEELAVMFEVSTRTIYRDLDAINQEGIPIRTVSGPGNGISIMEAYKVEKKLFSTADITAILLALSSIKTGLPGFNATNTLAKIKGLIPDKDKLSLEFHMNQIKIDMNPWLGNEEITSKIELIQLAIESLKHIQFLYRDIQNQQSRRTIEPYRLLWKSAAWYIQGYCLSRKDFRTFKIIRIEKLQILDQTFEPRPFTINETGRFGDIQLVAVTLRINERIKDDIIERFGSSCLSPEGGGFYTAVVHMPDEELAYRYLMGFGGNCECLGPKAFRTNLKKYIATLYDMYY